MKFNLAKNEKKTKFGSAILDQESSPAKQDQLVASIFDEIKKQAESVQSPVIFNYELMQGTSLSNGIEGCVFPTIVVSILPHRLFCPEMKFQDSVQTSHRARLIRAWIFYIKIWKRKTWAKIMISNPDQNLKTKRRDQNLKNVQTPKMTPRPRFLLSQTCQW